jgi:hypothetical protein
MEQRLTMFSVQLRLVCYVQTDWQTPDRQTDTREGTSGVRTPNRSFSESKFRKKCRSIEIQDPQVMSLFWLGPKATFLATGAALAAHIGAHTLITYTVLTSIAIAATHQVL